MFNENESIRIFFCELKNNFYEDLKIKSCILKKSKSIYLINVMIDSDCFDYSFINKTIVRKICETLNINSMRLIKSKTVKNMMINFEMQLHMSFFFIGRYKIISKI